MTDRTVLAEQDSKGVSQRAATTGKEGEDSQKRSHPRTANKGQLIRKLGN